MIENQREWLSTILEAIPSVAESPRTVAEICAQAGCPDPECIEKCHSILAILALFDAVASTQSSIPGEHVYRATAFTSSLFLRSLAAYSRAGRPIVSNWERLGIKQGLCDVHEFLSGPQFLYMIENQRTAADSNSPPIRTTIVVKALIRAGTQKGFAPSYLMQFDPNARQFQLIGGHKRSDDKDVQTAMIREVEEELNRNSLHHPKDFDLQEVTTLTQREISSTYGALTEYQLHYFSIVFRHPRQLALGPNDRWVSEAEVLAGQTNDGVKINESAFDQVVKNLPQGGAQLPVSLQQVQQRTLLTVAREHPGQTVSIVLGILGIIVSFIFWMLG
jgi:hypothetical protein